MNLILWLCLAVQDIPAPTDDYVNDLANLISEPDRLTMAQLCRKLWADCKIPIVIATVMTQSDYTAGKGASVEAFAKAWYDAWKIGASAENRGLLLLFLFRDRKVRIELGRGFGRSYDNDMQNVTTGMTSYFKRQQYSEGLTEGVRRLDRFARRIANPSAPEPSPQYQPPPYVPSQPPPRSNPNVHYAIPGFDCGFSVIGIMILFVVLLVILSIARSVSYPLYHRPYGYYYGGGPSWWWWGGGPSYNSYHYYNSGSSSSSSSSDSSWGSSWGSSSDSSSSSSSGSSFGGGSSGGGGATGSW